MIVDENNGYDIIDNAVWDERIFNIKEITFAEDTCYGECGNDDPRTREWFENFGAFERNGEWWFPKGMKFSITPQKNFFFFTAHRNGSDIEFMHLDGVSLDIPLTPLGEKCLIASKKAEDKSFVDIVKDILYYMDYFNIS